MNAQSERRNEQFSPSDHRREEEEGAQTQRHQTQQQPDSLSAPPSQEHGPSDARLIEDVRNGDRDAFGTLVLRYESRLTRVIMRFVNDPDLAQDLTQETFIRAYERLDQFDPSRRFGPWLFRIGVNLTLDFLRRRKRTGRWSLFSESPNESGMEPAVSDPRQKHDLSQEVHQVLDQIPEKYRMVLVLRDLENFSTSEIAAITDRKEATIRWRLAEARNYFQSLWEKRQDSLGHSMMNERAV